MFWGLTPALDLLEQYKLANKEVPSELNVLLVGGVDSRHILKTVARRYRHTKTKINFYVAETCVETIAKQLLLLNIALQHQNVMGLVQKTKIFMELYGNTLVRPYVAKYLTSVAQELVKMVTNYDYLKEKMPFVTMEMKYKERDYLENLLKFWCSRDDFDICGSWDRRLRKTLGVRYDSKLGAFDWDLHMRYHSVGGKQVCNQEYRNFRLNGVAFNWLESEVSKPNRSMVCVVVPNGEKFIHYGYVGDIQTGPFVAYGLECEDENFLKCTNGQNSHRATDVTERNLCQIFHEIQFQKEYIHQSISDVQLGPAIINTGEKRVIDIKASVGGAEINNINKCLPLEEIEIKFISVSLLDLIKYRSEYKHYFNLIYFGNCYLKYISKELINNIAAPNTLLLIENQIFVLSYREKQLKEFGEEIKKVLNGAELKLLESFDVCKDYFVKFVKT